MSRTTGNPIEHRRIVTPDNASGRATRKRPRPGTEGELHASQKLPESAMSREQRVPKHPGVSRREDGSYSMRVTDGKGRRCRVTGRTISEVKAKAAAVRTDARRGEIHDESQSPFDEYARAWVATCPGRSEKGLRDETRAEYSEVLERHAIPYFHRQRISTITPAHIKAFAAHIAQGRSRNTVRLALAPVRAMLADAAELGDIRANPARGVRIGNLTSDTAKDQEVKALTPEEAAALLAELPEHYRLLVRFLLETGVRISEAAALTWADLDFATGRVRVEKRYRRGNLGSPKSAASRRSVPMADTLSRALWRARKESTDPSDGGLVFGRDGRYLNSMSVAGWFRVAARKAGVSWATPHCCRHTCASWLLQRGLSIKQVQVWLGHANAAITLGVYSHLVPEDLPASPFGDDLGTIPAETSRDDQTETGPETVLVAAIPS
jgi:integrase